LSPLLFCLAEDVLSRSISKLVSEGKLDLIIGAKNYKIPSHTLYVDDVMIFCSAKMSGILNLENLFIEYANCSGQCVNPIKSSL